MPRPTPNRKAYSYARFSTAEQADGRSLERQLKMARDYCARHGLTLDERRFADLGVSAYHGANASHGELGEFLELVEEGRVPAGSVLIVENVDRLSRMDPDEATALIMKIVRAGVDVVTASPEQRYTRANIHQTGVWVPLQVALCLAAEESRKKGERVADAWAEKRKTASTVPLTKRGPAWLRLAADRKGWVVVPERAELVRKMFALAAEGHGVARISEAMYALCPSGWNGKGWQPGHIKDTLRSRSVLGEYQPHVGTCAKKGRKKTRRPVGDPVKGYFPAVVAEAEFYRVQAALDGRRRGGGRAAGTPNMFNGLLHDARDRQRMVVNSTNGVKVLVSHGAIRGAPGSAFRSVRYDGFERAVLGELAELTPADVLGRPGEAEDRVAAVSGRLTAVNRNLDAAKAKASAAEDVTAFLDVIADLDRQRQALIRDLEQAKAKAFSERGDNLGEFKSLVELLDSAAPEERVPLRRKVRAALRRVVASIHVLIVPRGRDRIIAAQVWFAGGEGRHRDYLMLYRSGHGRGPLLPKREGSWSRPRSLADVARLGPLDLRERDHAARLEKALLALDTDL